jgi:hypothetical protein
MAKAATRRDKIHADMAENTKSDSNKPQKPGSSEKTKMPADGSPERNRQPQKSPSRMPPDKASVNDDLDLDDDDEDTVRRSLRPDRDEQG